MTDINKIKKLKYKKFKIKKQMGNITLNNT